MSNKKISELELVTANASGDQFPLVQNGETMKTTMSKIVTYLDTFFTTTAEVAAQITAAITSKLSLTGGTMSGAIAMGTNKITGLGDPTANQDAATKFYVDNLSGEYQTEYNLGNTASGTTAVTINATSGVATFTQVLTRKTSAYYEINNTQIEAGDFIEYSLQYEGAGYPVMMHYRTIASRIRIHIANIAVDGGSGIDTNANLVVTFRKI
jgi:hypothetical protein